MKRPLFSPPDSFSLLPFVVVLPVVSSLSRLEPLIPALFARSAKLEELLLNRGGIDDQAREALLAEQAMLKTALGWIQRTGSEQQE